MNNFDDVGGAVSHVSSLPPLSPSVMSSHSASDVRAHYNSINSTLSSSHNNSRSIRPSPPLPPIQNINNQTAHQTHSTIHAISAMPHLPAIQQSCAPHYPSSTSSTSSGYIVPVCVSSSCVAPSASSAVVPLPVPTPSPNAASISYSAIQILGTGSFGVVYLATVDKEPSIHVAIKKVKQDKKFKNRELHILSMLRHPNIIRLQHCFYSKSEPTQSHGDTNQSTASSSSSCSSVTGSASTEPELFLNLVMDYMPYSLYRVLRNQQKAGTFLDKRDVKLYAWQLCRAIAHIHIMGISHRDIKPQNILVDPTSKVLKVCDFGSSKQLSANSPSVSYICSRFYRAPELVFQAQFYTNAIDSWSVGCLSPDTQVWLHDGSVVRADELQPHHQLLGDDGKPVSIVPNTLSGTASTRQWPAFQASRKGFYVAPWSVDGTPTLCPGHLPVRRIVPSNNTCQAFTVSNNHLLTIAHQQKHMHHQHLDVIPHNTSDHMIMKDVSVESLESSNSPDVSPQLLKYAHPLEFPSNPFVRSALNSTLRQLGMSTGSVDGIDYSQHIGGDRLMYRAATLAHAITHSSPSHTITAMFNPNNYMDSDHHTIAIFPPSPSYLMSLHIDVSIEVIAEYLVSLSSWLVGLWLSSADDSSRRCLFHPMSTPLDTHTQAQQHAANIRARALHWMHIMGIKHTETWNESQFDESIILHAQHTLLINLQLTSSGVPSPCNHPLVSLSSSARVGFQQAPVAVRLALLSGLIDGSGYREPHDDTHAFITCSESLAHYVALLLRQTGFNTSAPTPLKHVDQHRWQLIDIIAHYDHSARLQCASAHKRTVGVGQRSVNPFLSHFTIQSANSNTPQPVVCFQVANASQRFLLADGTVTHNCVIGEMLRGRPLFEGDSSIDQLLEIMKVLGIPTVADLYAMNPLTPVAPFPALPSTPIHTLFTNPAITVQDIQFIMEFLKYDPNQRLTPLKALAHPFFDDLRADRRVGEPDLFTFTNEELYALHSLNMVQHVLPASMLHYVHMQHNNNHTHLTPNIYTQVQHPTHSYAHPNIQPQPPPSSS